MIKQNIEPRCGNCGSADVYMSRIAYWSFFKQRWVEEPFADDFHCNQCGENNVIFHKCKAGETDA